MAGLGRVYGIPCEGRKSAGLGAWGSGPAEPVVLSLPVDDTSLGRMGPNVRHAARSGARLSRGVVFPGIVLSKLRRHP